MIPAFEDIVLIDRESEPLEIIESDYDLLAMMWADATFPYRVGQDWYEFSQDRIRLYTVTSRMIVLQIWVPSQEYGHYERLRVYKGEK